MIKLIANTKNRYAVHRRCIAFILIAFLVGCGPFTNRPNTPAYWPTNGWQSITPEEEGMDSEKLVQMIEYIQEEKLDLHSMLIVRNGYLVSELYVYPYSAGQAQGVMSVTKSVMGTLIGIAIEKGYIKNVHQSLFSLLSDEEVANLDEQKKSITLEDLLTMTSGLDCHENLGSGEAIMQTSTNWVQFMLDQPIVAQPGTKFNYCTSAVQVLSAVLQKATGMSTRQFANENLLFHLELVLLRKRGGHLIHKE
jgi:CubicO group peptidase (beta-lactamase class C family)